MKSGSLTITSTVPDADLLDLDRPDPCLDGSLRQMTVSHQTLPAIFGGQIAVGGKKIGNFDAQPYRLLREPVDVRVAARTIEILHKGRRVAAHARGAAVRAHVTAAKENRQ